MAKKQSGGIGKELKGIIAILVIAGFVLSVARMNNITDVKSAFAYFKSWSDYVSVCMDKKPQWKCAKGVLPGGKVPSASEAVETDASSSESASTSSSSTTVESSPTVAGGNSEYFSRLNSIVVAPSQKVAYKRTEWKHWVKQEGSCNTRELALKKQGRNVVSDPKTCKIISGEWTDPYSGEVFTDPKKLDLDHVIPLANASRNGGQKWDAKTKERFANDLSQLLVVSARENRVKSDAGPGEYMPPAKEYHCQYSKIWIDTAVKYQISINDKDKKALEKGLASCK